MKAGITRRRFAQAGVSLGLLPLLGPATRSFAADGNSTLRIGMSISDIPLPNGQTDQGSEGMRFIGFNLFEALVAWDLSSATKASELKPGLATEWEVDPADKRKWTFRLRENVKFHDGSEFNADSVIWNFDKILKESAPQFDARQSANGRVRVPTVREWRKVDAHTVEFVTEKPDALLPYSMTWIVMSSPAQWEAVGGKWENFLTQPSGTGPWRLEAYVPRQNADLVPNKTYWNEERIPKVDRLRLIPMPDPNTRTSALLSEEIDWAEAPAPDLLPILQSRSFNIVTNVLPHNWIWHFSRVEGSPWNDLRVRKAANLAVDRAGIKGLLGGLMVEAKGMVPPTSPWFGKPEFDVVYDPEQALALMKEVGHDPQNPLRAKVMIAPNGGGMMQPLPMNEVIQQNLAAIGIDVQFEVVDWNNLSSAYRAGAKNTAARGCDAVNNSNFSQDPFTALIRHLRSDLAPPSGTNWGFYSDEEMDRLMNTVQTEFDPEVQLKAIQAVHEKYVNDALFLFVAHDVNPRALSPRVQDFVQAQNWFQDFTPIRMG